MALATNVRLAETREAFDGVAPDYDRSNTTNSVLVGMRRRVMATLVRHVPPGSRVLDLGCGPGTDDEALGRAGYAVTAIDWSPAMVAEAERRIATAGLRARVDVRRLGIQELDRLPEVEFDAAMSNFGPLNCVPDLADAVRQIGRRLRPGGVFMASVIGRVCPWELAIYLTRGDWRRARVRFERDFVGVPLNGRTVWTRYYSPGEFAAACSAAGMFRTELRALGLFAPPPYLNAFADRHPGLMRGLQALDDRLGTLPALRTWGDHFLMVLRKG